MPYIPPLTLLAGTGCFLCSMVVHIEVWRSRPETRTISRLFAIFVFWPALLLLSLAGAGLIFESPGSAFVRNPFNLAYLFIWHLALSAVYIMTYPAMQAQSPTLVLVLAIARRMPGGVEAQEIQEIFPPDSLLRDRFADLISDGFLVSTGESYALTAKGRLVCTIFSGYRKILGLPRGEG